jgi:hypothetical protein
MAFRSSGRITNPPYTIILTTTNNRINTEDGRPVSIPSSVNHPQRGDVRKGYFCERRLFA